MRRTRSVLLRARRSGELPPASRQMPPAFAALAVPLTTIFLLLVEALAEVKVDRVFLCFEFKHF